MGREYKIVVYRNGPYQFRWRLIGKNGQEMGCSRSGCTRRSDAVRAARRAQAAMCMATLKIHTSAE